MLTPKDFPCWTGRHPGHLGVGSRPALPGRGLAPFFATSSKALGGFSMTPLEGWVFGGHVFSLFTRSLLLMEDIFWRFSVEVDSFSRFFSIPLFTIHVVSKHFTRWCKSSFIYNRITVLLGSCQNAGRQEDVVKFRSGWVPLIQMNNE